MNLVDTRGRPLQLNRAQSRADLARPHARATLTGVRQVWDAESVASGLTPETLAGILRQADEGDGRAYLRLAIEMEQREAHYRSVLSTRKRAVTRLPVTVEAASEASADTALAEEIRALIRAPGFRGMLAHALDGLGKGFAVIELRWDTSRSPWMPRDRDDRASGERIRGYQWIDPRWFRYDRENGRALRLLDEADPINGLVLPPYRYLIHEPELMSGHPLGAGLARVACVAYLAKSFTLKDWLAFAEVYGMPLRVGKYGPGASEEDIGTLVSAVANLGTDAAAVIPESMLIEFVEAAKSSSSDVFSSLATWADRQLSKVVLGQVASSEGQPGSLGAQQAQDEVRKDLRDADAEELADTLNRDLVGAYLALNHGLMDPDDSPSIQIRAPDSEDIPVLTDALARLVPLGLRVEQGVIRDKLGIPDPPEGAELLGAAAPTEAAAEPGEEVETAKPPSRSALQVNRLPAGPSGAQPAPQDAVDALTERLAREADPQMAAMVARLRDMAERAESLPELLEMLEAAWGQLDSAPFAETLAMAGLAAELGGMAEVLDEAGRPAERASRDAHRVATRSPIELTVRVEPAPPAVRGREGFRVVRAADGSLEITPKQDPHPTLSQRERGSHEGADPT